MDIGGWLRSLGLKRFETTFRENEITEATLSSRSFEAQSSKHLRRLSGLMA